jgi:hypothetical protein
MSQEWESESGDRRLNEGEGSATGWFHRNRSKWLRGLLMLAFYLVLGLIRLLVGLMALFQLGSLILTGEANERLARFGAGLALYTADLIAYLTCAEESLPFPFSDWPRPEG